MKDLIARLKAKGFKQIAIDHGEWLVAGVLGLALLMALWVTNWKRYEGTPEELTAKVESASQAIAANTWEASPDAEKYTAAAGLKEAEVHQLLAADEATRTNLVEQELQKYQMSASLLGSVYRGQEPAQQPDVLPPVELIVTPSRALIARRAEVSASDQLADNAAEAPEEEEGRRRLKSDRGGGNGAFNPGRLAAGPTPGGAFAGGPGPNMRGGTIPGAAQGSGGEADGMAFNAVRGIVPLFRQVREFETALNVSSKEAAPLVSYWDFRLERRSRPAGETGEWSEWTPVDIKTAEEVLSNAEGWDAEMIDIALTDPVLTMSLPSRVFYAWMKSEASHPKIDEYVLPDSMRERQMQLYKIYLEQQLEALGAEQDQTKGGLSRLQHGNRNMMAGLAASMRTPGGAGVIDKIAEVLDSSDKETAKQEIIQQWLQRETAAGRLLLFRYFDFDVKPGMSYQYRVQLVLANPNYQRPQQLVVDPEITRERFLTSPFSEPTPEVTVPRNVNYFVTRVDDANGSNPPSATFDVYQWSTDYGTTINDQLKVYFGGFVADRRKADVVDPAAPAVLEGQEVDFNSDDVLIDVLNAPGSIDVGQHPELKDLSRDKLMKGLGVAEQALLVNEFGDLVAIDSLSAADSHARTKKRYENEQKDLEGIKSTTAGAMAGPGGFDAGAAEARFGGGPGGPMAGPGMGMGAGGRGGRGGGALRRGSRGR